MKILTKKIKKLRLSIHNVISAWYNEIDLRGEKMKFTSFVQLLHSGATNYPDNVALLYDEGGTTVKKRTRSYTPTSKIASARLKV